MSGASRSAMSLKTVSLETLPLKMVPIRPGPMTDMGLGCDRRELNDDQKDRRPKYPQKCAGRNHAQLLPYDPSRGNNG